MPVKNDTGFSTFDFRGGPDLKFGGMVTEGDPASVPSNRFRMLVNTRFTGSGLRERPGQTKFTSTALGDGASAEVRHLATYEIATPSKLYILTDGCPGISSSAGFALFSLDQEQSPENQAIAYYSTSDH